MITAIERVLSSVEDLCDRSFDNFKARAAIAALNDVGLARFCAYADKDDEPAFTAGFHLFSLFARAPAAERRFLRKAVRVSVKALRRRGVRETPRGAAIAAAVPKARLPYAD